MRQLTKIAIAVVAAAALNSASKANELDVSSPKDSKPSVAITLSDVIANKDVTMPGFVVGNGPVQQTYAALTLDNKFIEGNKFTVDVWANHDLGDNAIHELHYGPKITQRIHEGDNLVIDALVGAKVLESPSHLLYDKPNYVGDFGLSVSSGKVSANLLCRNLVPGNGHGYGTLVHLNAAWGDALPLGKKLKLTYGVDVSVAGIHNYFADRTGLTHFTPNVKFGLAGNRWSSELSAGYQKSIMPGVISDTVVLGASLTVKMGN